MSAVCDEIRRIVAWREVVPQARFLLRPIICLPVHWSSPVSPSEPCHERKRHLEEKLSRARFLNAVLGVVVFVAIAGSAWLVNDQRLLLGASSEPTERNVDYRQEAIEQRRIAEQSIEEAMRQTAIAEKQKAIAENEKMIAVAEKEMALKVMKSAEVARGESEKQRRMAEEHEQIARAETRKAEEARNECLAEIQQLKTQLMNAGVQIKKLEADQARASD